MVNSGDEAEREGEEGISKQRRGGKKLEEVPRNLSKRNDFPEPHLAKRPTVMGIVSDGSLNISANALLYSS